MMKKILALLLASLMAICLLSACGSGGGKGSESESTTEKKTYYSDEDKAYFAAETAIKELKNHLKRPSSLELNNVIVVYDYAYNVAIDYSAQNELGGYVRNVNYSIYKVTFPNGELKAEKDTLSDYLDKYDFEDKALDSDNDVFELDLSKLNY